MSDNKLSVLARTEASLRDIIRRSPLGTKTLFPVYNSIDKARYHKQWDRPVSFRGSNFIIGRDVSLFPSVKIQSFEKAEFDWLLPKVRENDVIWDIGANIGIYCITLSKAKSGVVVEAFEPWPETIEKLKVNLRNNRVSNVNIHEIALSNKVGQIGFVSLPDAPGCNHMATNSGICVETTTGESVVENGTAKPDIIKIDVEGFEPEVLDGMRNLLKDSLPTLLFEVNTFIITHQEWEEKWEDMLSWLFSLYNTGTWFVDGRVEYNISKLSEGKARLQSRAGSLAFCAR